MSVLVITKVNADPSAMEKVSAANADVLEQISAEARSRGAQHHLFADDGEGHVLIVDVWDAASTSTSSSARRPTSVG